MVRLPQSLRLHERPRCQNVGPLINLADYRASYSKEGAEDAWKQMQAWFKKYGVLGG